MTDKMLSFMHPNSVNMTGLEVRAMSRRRADQRAAFDGLRREYERLWSYAQGLTRQSEVRPDPAVVYTPGEDSTFYLVQYSHNDGYGWIKRSTHKQLSDAKADADDTYVQSGVSVRVVRIGPEEGSP